jgi:hypothetical protein
MHVTYLKNHILQELLAAANNFVDLSLYTGRDHASTGGGESSERGDI